MSYVATEKIFKALKYLSKITPTKVKIATAFVLSNIWYYIHKKYRNRIEDNIIFIKPNIEKKELKIKTKRVFLNLIYNLGSFIESYNSSKEDILKKVKFINEEILLTALKKNKPIIFLTGHYSNWEILPLAIAAKYTPLTGVGRPLNQPSLNHILVKTREQFGNKMVSKHGATKELVKLMQNNKVVGLLTDQNLGGIEVDFFNKPTIQSTTISKLAYKFDAIVIPCFISRVGFERYIATFYEPIEAEKSDQKKFIQKHTQKEAKIIENVVKKDITQWLLIHKRWKANHPNIYR